MQASRSLASAYCPAATGSRASIPYRSLLQILKYSMSKESARPIVHLIDDDFAVRHSTELLLQIADIDVRAYASGSEFLNDANPNEIRCLVIDMNMPGMNGIDLLDRLRRSGVLVPA